ncbi:MAG: cytochrome C, partial [Proteobacteria bacterium]
MARLKAAALLAWHIVSTPAATLSLGFLTLGGFLGGVIFWGAFNTALELTNTEPFCISCHEMENNVYEELREPFILPNRSGV